MLQSSQAFSGFSVKDIGAAKDFYSNTLGLQVVEGPMGLRIEFNSGATVFIYHKDDHEPANYTILNFPVDNIDVIVDELSSKGVEFEHYTGLTDEKGIARGLSLQRGPDIAWFKDPSGNIFSVLQQARNI
jgi:catechol 2,3-dioxygenase-like lactoylglutathione lyase family enzyme